jgi:CAAX prenyl protease-like protein
LYLVLTQFPPRFPEYYPWLYSAVVLLVGALTLGLLRGRPVLRPHRHILPGVAVGLAGVGLWIALSQLQAEQRVAAYLPAWLRPSPRAAFDPFQRIAHPPGRWCFVALRLAGLALLVPVIEELFWRGFLARWLIAPDWGHRRPGEFTPSSFAVVTVFFTLTHPEWLAAAVYCSLLNGLLYWKRDLWDCVVAHGVSNLVLALYILFTGAWELW